MSPLTESTRLVCKNYGTPAAIAGVAPTLDYRFALDRTELDAVTLTDKLTLTRAATAAFTNLGGNLELATANVPRFDHSPSTRQSLGLLVEEARTNLFLYSQEIDTGNWTKNNITTTANAGTAPDGTTTAELLTTASTTIIKLFSANPQPVLQTSSDYCVSFYVKLISGTGTAAKAGISSSNGAISPNYASYELRLDNFAESTGGNLPSVRGYTILPNGWVRMYMVFNTSTQTNANLQFRFGEINTVSSFYVWGLQVEKGAFPTSYIPTTTATVTRAETATVSLTGLPATRTLVEKPVGCATVAGDTLTLNAGYTAERVMVFPTALSGAQVTAIRSAM